MNETLSFFASLVMNMVGLYISVWIWNKLWVQTGYDCYIPRAYFLYDLNLGLTHDREIEYKSSDIKEIFKAFKVIIQKFDTDYFIRNCGFDAYSYLYIQRSYLISMVNLGGWGIVYFVVKEILNIVQDWNKEIYSIAVNYIFPTTQIFWTVFISAHFIHTIIKTRHHLQLEYIKCMIQKNRKSGLDWLKLRSVHIKGVPPSDIGGIGLRQKIEDFLRQNGDSGKIIELVVIPTYGEIMRLEQEKVEIQIIREIVMGMQDDMNIVSKLLLKKYQDDDYYFNRIAEMDDFIEQAIQDSVQCSGHAFVCFDKLSSLLLVLNMFKDHSKNQFKLAYNSLKNNIQDRTPVQQSVYLEKYEIPNYDKNVVLISKPVADQMDIQWLNMEGEGKGYSQLYRWIVNFILLLVILFLSTPTAILYMIEEVKFLKVLKLEWAQNYPIYIRQLIKTEVPALCIVGLNQLFLLLINWCVYFEKNIRKSKYQAAIFTKCFFYMILTVLIVPNFAIESKLPLYQILFSQNSGKSFEEHSQENLSKMYQYHNGLIYATIIQQSAVVSVLCYLNRLGYIFTNYVSPFIVHYTTLFQRENKNYSRPENEGFLYGYASAYMLLIILIGFVFFFSTSWILISVVIYLAIRHALDCYILLVVHKREQESSGYFGKTILVYSVIVVIIFQTIMLAYFYFADSDKGFNYYICLMVLIMTIFIAITLDKPLLDIRQLEDVKLNSKKQKLIDQKKWVRYFRHPLILPFPDENLDESELSLSHYSEEHNEIQVEDSILSKYSDSNLNDSLWKQKILSNKNRNSNTYNLYNGNHNNFNNNINATSISNNITQETTQQMTSMCSNNQNGQQKQQNVQQQQNNISNQGQQTHIRHRAQTYNKNIQQQSHLQQNGNNNSSNIQALKQELLRQQNLIQQNMNNIKQNGNAGNKHTPRNLHNNNNRNSNDSHVGPPRFSFTRAVSNIPEEDGEEDGAIVLNKIKSEEQNISRYNNINNKNINLGDVNNNNSDLQDFIEEYQNKEQK